MNVAVLSALNTLAAVVSESRLLSRASMIKSYEQLNVFKSGIYLIMHSPAIM
jgi:hypothetical protein